MHCPLCGFEYDEKQLACHIACPLAPGCAIICCPNCGYQMVDEDKSRLAKLLRRLWKTKPDRRDLARSDRAGLNGQLRVNKQMKLAINNLKPGQTALVVELLSADPARLDRLCSYGMAPGSLVRVEQLQPALILRIGETEISIDEAVAREIIVEAQ